MKRISMTIALAAVAGLSLAACGNSSDPTSTSSTSSSSSGSSSSSDTVVVGSANFSENVVLADIYAGALNAAGVKASTKLNIGAREIYLKALKDGSIDIIPEYTGSIGFYYDKSFSKTDPQEVYDAAKALLPADFQMLDKSAAEDNDSITVSKATADSKHLKTIEDLKAVAKDLTLGAMPEFKTRPQGVPGLEKTYGLTFKEFRPLTGQALVQALKNGQIDAANIFTTDPAIPSNNFVTLEDTKRLFGSQNIVPLVRKDVADKVAATLNKVSAALTTDKLVALLKETDVDKKDPDTVAKQFLADNNLG